MSIYPSPTNSNIFNPIDFLTTPEEIEKHNDDQDDDIDHNIFVNKSGDIMSGILTVPQLKFPDNTSQITAFTNIIKNNVATNTSKLSSVTEFADVLLFNKIGTNEVILIDGSNGNNQTIKYLDKIQIDSNKGNIQLNIISIQTNTGNISTNTTNIGTNTTNISTNTNNITANSNNITTNTNSITANSNNITTNTNSITTNTNSITANSNNITANSNNITANTTEITANSNNITANTNNITSNTTDINAIKVKTDVIESVGTTITYQRHNVGFRHLTTGGNVGYIGAVGNFLFIGADGANPIIMNPDYGYIHNYCENTLFGDDKGPGRIILNDSGGLSGSITIGVEVQNNAYTDADHLAVSNLRPSPIGGVIAFAGTIAPTHYLICNGAEISQTTYAALYAVIGLLYSHGRTTSPGSGNFFLPQLQAGSIMGAGTDITHIQKITNSTIKNVGDFNQMSVQGHSHMFSSSGSESAANGAPSKTVGSNNFSSVKTNGTMYDDGTPMFGITQPNNVAMHYIIQYE